MQQGRQDARLYQIDDQKPDPFAKHPIEMTPELEKFYAQGWQKWNSDFKGPERHLFPHSRFSAIFRSAWDDEALHYGLLSVVATQIAMLRNGAPDQVALELQLKVITHQRKALSRGGMSDARVMTALCIMSNAFANGGAQDLLPHMKLVSTWLHQRGGLQYLGMEGIIADNLMYADHTKAVVHVVPPVYNLQLPAIPSSTAPSAGEVYTELQQRELISEEVASAATNYSVLVRIFDSAAKGHCTASQGSYFAYLSNIVEYQLACLNVKLQDTNTLDECLVHACLIGNHTLLRNYGQLSPIARFIEPRFWRCLDHLREKQFFAMNDLQNLECYLVCIGTMTSLRKPSTHEARVVEIMIEWRREEKSKVPAFYELCDTMERFGWSESVCLTLYAKLWNKSSDMLSVKVEGAEE